MGEVCVCVCVYVCGGRGGEGGWGVVTYKQKGKIY